MTLPDKLASHRPGRIVKELALRLLTRSWPSLGQGKSSLPNPIAGQDTGNPCLSV